MAVGLAGPRQEAEEIKTRLGAFMHQQLRIELSPAKTLITHGRTTSARFLGDDIVVLHADRKHDRRGHRSINAAIGLNVPAAVIRAKCKPYLHRGKPVRWTERIVDTDFSIVAQFHGEFRGVAQYCWRSTAIDSDGAIRHGAVAQPVDQHTPYGL